MERTHSGCVKFKNFPYFSRFLSVNIYSTSFWVVEIAHRSPAGPYAVSDFLPQSSLHILSQIIYKIF
ncbi:MAG: hypothetical protein A2W52_01880 [Candidatus Taylorbacteria bacterium RIFCSPHIGHO2_02_49_25]|uniref:Uncharacterized protein n=1 Tax=Candidatus Taylorbacteria bacterium RIFCSPHIGHO2_02_49_25 TaxID=1802305 RepID=A0A1G2MCY0_9BACT|nr:MAG: hypothetical protein A2W52_01880 [Candidatus Taylorbacteria bacterium RIFCSPHIGHO2_02_49_25]OHA47397.1 MAG: hypothetical protein A3G61_04410 [Candidatus Taylorbacteria bacterium RIFCSPLOWO2_12_FULL_49_67]